MPLWVSVKNELFLSNFGRKWTLFLDVAEYWPEVKDDLTKVIWSHATNSKVKLQTALEGKIEFISEIVI